MTKKIMIAAFVYKNKQKWFLEYLYEEFDIEHNKVFIFESLNHESKHIYTFYIEIGIDERINLRDYFNHALIIHKKRKTFYTINALNSLIEREHNLEKGNIVYKDWKIDWNNHEDQLIINSNNKLVLMDLIRVFY
jgi:hypothetical protein